MTSEALPHGLTGRDEARAYFAWMASLYGAALAGVVLDHGAGTGALCERLVVGSSQVIALEPEALLFEKLVQRFALEPKVEPMHGDIASYLAARGPRRLDAVVSSNVLEHLTDDVDCMRQIGTALKPGGAFAVYVPARAELFGSLDESVGHLRRYTRSGLRQRLEAAGFFVEWVRYVNLAGALPWLVIGRVLKRRAIAPNSLRLFDRVIFPVAMRLEGLLGVPYGLNVAALARAQ